MKVIEERAIQDNQIEEEEGWAVTEFADADLQDAQRTKLQKYSKKINEENP
jgi:DNA-binding ferritin-like protein (Dps family)